MKPLSILAIADTHYIGIAEDFCKAKNRKAELALELVRGILGQVDRKKIDAVLLLGDLVNNGNATGAESDMEALSTELKKMEKPVVVVPGNHDMDAGTVLKIFGDHEGLHDLEGYQFITFADVYRDKIASRNWIKMEEAFSRADPERPLIVLQHSPVYPPIDKAYPYNINEADRVMEYYTQKGVLLSISGHAHWGIPPMTREDVGYLTCPALCESPFRYTLITLKGHEYEVRDCPLYP